MPKKVPFDRRNPLRLMASRFSYDERDVEIVWPSRLLCVSFIVPMCEHAKYCRTNTVFPISTLYKCPAICNTVSVRSSHAIARRAHVGWQIQPTPLAFTFVVTSATTRNWRTLLFPLPCWPGDARELFYCVGGIGRGQTSPSLALKFELITHASCRSSQNECFLS